MMGARTCATRASLSSSSLRASLCSRAPSMPRLRSTRARNANGVVEATNVPDALDFRLTYPGKGTLIHSRSFRRIAYDGRFDRHILDAARACSPFLRT